MKAPSLRTLIIIITIVWIAFMAIGLSACRTVDVTRQRTSTDSTVAQRSTFDSTSYALAQASMRFASEIARDYKPGRDSIIYRSDGQPIIIPGQPQLIREIIRESGEKNQRTEQATTTSRTDSLLAEILRSGSSKEKETSSIPAWGWFCFAALGYFLIKDLIRKP